LLRHNFTGLNIHSPVQSNISMQHHECILVTACMLFIEGFMSAFDFTIILSSFMSVATYLLGYIIIIIIIIIITYLLSASVC